MREGIPEAMLNARLYPTLPPEGKPSFCFYPRSKLREAHANWFTLPFDERSTLMHEHGASGRKFAGRVLQVVTGSTGLDDFEWGVTLFAQKPDDLKEVVYTMRFDRASADYADFGAFYTGFVCSPEELVATI
ncbi:MAG: chlorite dismutase family protein [Ilumatobacteraceae bacterium]